MYSVHIPDPAAQLGSLPDIIYDSFGNNGSFGHRSWDFIKKTPLYLKICKASWPHFIWFSRFTLSSCAFLCHVGSLCPSLLPTIFLSAFIYASFSSAFWNISAPPPPCFLSSLFLSHGLLTPSFCLPIFYVSSGASSPFLCLTCLSSSPYPASLPLPLPLSFSIIILLSLPLHSALPIFVFSVQLHLPLCACPLSLVSVQCQ